MVSTRFALFIVAWNVIYWSIAGGCSSWWNTNAGGIKTANCRKTWVKQLRWKVKLVHISVPGSFIRAVDDILFLVPFTETAPSPIRYPLFLFKIVQCKISLCIVGTWFSLI